MEDIKFVERHKLKKLLQLIDTKKMAGSIYEEAAPSVTWSVPNGDSRDF